ncbi:TspO/MBR related protein [Tenacibaculum skagerrakense]|uniref:TspO/MBR related protein n=1 Tax=Tenacibaculum skagerrakense TaxID=186571 RepID=A0A4R2NMU6_9FLAO|nr:TspO/MBR family protein [Tenacibaculum skagerrakense]TCP22957.1 TspO/MBR related protein [Tenacibaculum skagerrakense]
MNKVKFTLLFLFINFSALYVGSFLMGEGPTDVWYQSLNKAPWTPPGWVFGAAWTLIMICFSIYLGFLFSEANTKKVQLTFLLQLILNVSWNYIFFNQKWVSLGVLVLILLIVTLLFFFVNLSKDLKKVRLLLLPYIIWLCIATSLNLYILIHN